MAAPRGVVHRWGGRMGGKKTAALYPYLKTNGNREGIRWDELIRLVVIVVGTIAFLIFLNSAPSSPAFPAVTVPAFSTVPIVQTPLPFGRPSSTPAPVLPVASLVPSSTPTPTLTPTITPTWICPRFDPDCHQGKYDEYNLMAVTDLPTLTPTLIPTLTLTPTREFMWINGCCLAYWNGRGWEIVSTPAR